MDENIVLELNLDDPMPSIIEKELEDASDYMCLSFKKNFSSEFEIGDEEDFLATCRGYLNESNVKIKASTAGLHFQGKNKIPHFHYHFIVEASSISKTMIRNASTHRDRSEYAVDLKGISMKRSFLDPDKPKFQFLSYSFKEGHVCSYIRANEWLGKPMKKSMVDFLLSIGKTIYDTQCAKNLIRDKSEERKQNDYLELLNLVRDSKVQFPSFRVLQIWTEENFIEKIPPEKMIDITNYKKNLQRVGVALGIVKTYEL